MSLIDKVTKPGKKPPMIAIVGSPGVGKTTLGAKFPKPIFINAEDSSAVFESWKPEDTPDFLPRVPKSARDRLGNIARSTAGTLNALLRALLEEKHDYKTLVIDSVTTLDKLLGHELALRDKVKTVADASGGFHKGFAELAGIHADLVYKCEQLRAVRGMAIVFLAHLGIRKVKNSPDQDGDFTVYTLAMEESAASVYVSQSDAVLYLTQEAFIKTDAEKGGKKPKRPGKVIQLPQRKLITTGDGMTGFVGAKSRYEMPAEIEVTKNENPILQFVKFYSMER